MANEATGTAAEASKAAFDLIATVNSEGLSVEIKIDNVWLAGLAVVGTLSLGAYYLSRRQPTENAIRNVLERNEGGVVDPEVRRIENGSILVELFCHTERSFLSFVDDYRTNEIKLKLEEEFRKIGYEEELKVTISDLEEVYQKAYQIR